MKYDYQSDINYICKAKNLTLSSFANEIGINKSTITRIYNGELEPEESVIDKIYSYAFKNDIKINEYSSRLIKEIYNDYFFHGAKDNIIEHNIDLRHSREHLDFGKGFYCSKEYRPSAAFISMYKSGSVYVLRCHELEDLKVLEFDIGLKWLLSIMYFRGELEEYKNHPYIVNIINEINSYDIIIAPIANNNMYEVIDQFANDLLSDVQTFHMLESIDLGKQIVFRSEKAVSRLRIYEHLYVSSSEKKELIEERNNLHKDVSKRNESIKKNYFHEGKTIEEVLDDLR